MAAQHSESVTEQQHLRIALAVASRADTDDGNRQLFGNLLGQLMGTSAVRIDYFCSRLIVDHFSYSTRITFQLCT